ncbi:hypothetical protein ACFX43_22085 [Nocardioides sp. YIM B13467]|uniref:hypothetical protein n=1 Tax=Nocardioides sp. YIM B13467 TaxID=3366294 RepID=UPI00366F89A1
MAAKVLAKGRERHHGGLQKPWRVILYAPTAKYPKYRLTFKVPSESTPDTWEPTTRSRADEAEARDLFAQTEQWLNGLTDHAPATTTERRVRTIEVLGAAALAEAREQRLAARTIEQRASHIKAHIVPAIGNVRVDKWRVAHSRKVLDSAAKSRRPRGLEDVRTTMSTMRKLAWRDGWLPRSVDPLDGLKIAHQQGYHAASSKYVDKSLRPERRMVDAMADAADNLVLSKYQMFARFPFLGTRYRVAGYGGLRLGEQLGLRAVDVYFDEGCIFVNGSWTQPRSQDSPPFRGPVKNKQVHKVPLPASLMTELIESCRLAMNLPSDASKQQLVNAITGERQRRARQAPSPDRWWEVFVEPEDECWLWTDTHTGLPQRSESHNLYWHKVRRWVDKHDADNAWPNFITYRNMRHHAATWWHDELGLEWSDVALFLGDKLTTVLDHYVLPGADALKNAAEKLQVF